MSYGEGREAEALGAQSWHVAGRGGRDRSSLQGQESQDQPRGNEEALQRDIEYHPAVKKDLKRLDPQVARAAFATIESIANGQRHSSTHPLHGPLKGWEATDIRGNKDHRVTYRSVPGGPMLVGHIGPHNYDQAVQRLAALSLEDRISVAEHTMERAGHAGERWHVPAVHQDDPRREELHKPVHDFVNGVLQDHGHEGGIRVIPKHWDLRNGGGQAFTDGYNKIGLAGEHTNSMTLLHEAAHVLNRSHEGEGHDQQFARTLHGLYSQHIGPEAANTFAGAMGDHLHHTASQTTETLQEIGQREHPNVDHYQSGGMGHLEGDESRSVVGFMPTGFMNTYREHSGDQHHRSREVIDKIKGDLANGEGIHNPITVHYSDEHKWGFIGEGNHRLQAAREHGLRTVPVRVIRGGADVGARKKKFIGGPMDLEGKFDQTRSDRVEPYTPSDIHPHHFLHESAKSQSWFHGTSAEDAQNIIDEGARKGLNIVSKPNHASNYARTRARFHSAHENGVLLEGRLDGDEEEHPWDRNAEGKAIKGIAVTSRPNAFHPTHWHEVLPWEKGEEPATIRHLISEPMRHEAMGQAGPDYDNLTFHRGEHPLYPADRDFQTLFAHHPEHGNVGRLTYREMDHPAWTEMPEHAVHVTMMHVPEEHQRRGVASQLMDHLENHVHPNTPIDHGDRRPEGQEWAKSKYNDPKGGKENFHGEFVGGKSSWTMNGRPWNVNTKKYYRMPKNAGLNTHPMQNMGEWSRHLQGKQHVWDLDGSNGSHDTLCATHAHNRASLETEHSIVGLDSGLLGHDSEPTTYKTSNPREGKCTTCATHLRQEGEQLGRMRRQENPGEQDRRPNMRSPFSNGVPVGRMDPRGNPREHEEFQPRLPQSMNSYTAVQTPPEGLTFHAEDVETGGTKHPIRTHLRAIHPEHGQVGALLYYPPKRSNGRIAIDNLHVEPDQRRQGIGSALMDEVQRRHPDASIDHGDRTNDGQSWWSGYSEGKPVRRGRIANFRTWNEEKGGYDEPGEDDYRMQHRPPGRDGIPMHDMTHNLPADVYTHPHYYSDMNEPSNVEAHRQIGRVRGNPDAKVHIYRTLPAEHAHRGFRPGDWVSTSKDYARQHGVHENDPKRDWPVIHTTVRAGDLHTDADDFREFGYNGDKPKMGTVSFKGGYHQEVRQHADGVIRPVTRKEAAKFIPTKRVFTNTCGLDHRLFDGTKLRPEVRRYILKTLGAFWLPLYGVGWDSWSKVYFAGSEASEWTSDMLEGNNDFDVLVGVDYDKFKDAHTEYSGWTNEQITAQFNAQFKSLNNKNAWITVGGIPYGPFDNTWYVNQDSYNIKDIKPYAAYNVSDDRWAVKPPHLPHWSLSDVPRAVQRVLRACDTLANDVLKLPEPERTQQGNALFEAWHSDRSRAFGPNGEGWYDIANLREKWLDQEGTWAELVNCAHRWNEGLGAAHSDWSNTPRFGSYADYQRDQLLDKAKGIGDPERSDRMRELAQETHDLYSGGKYPHRQVGEPWVHPHNGQPMKAGWVKTEHMLPYAAHSGYSGKQSQDTIKHLKDDFESTGFQSPIDLHYHPETHSARIEGNHRLEAARQAGATHVPVMVHVDENRQGDRNGDDSYEPAQFPKPNRQFGKFEILHPSEVLPHEWLHPNSRPSGRTVESATRMMRPSELWPHITRDFDAPSSARKFRDLAKSIGEHGYKPEWADEPIHASFDPETHISDGNHRLKVMQQIGYDEPIPVHTSD